MKPKFKEYKYLVKGCTARIQTQYADTKDHAFHYNAMYTFNKVSINAREKAFYNNTIAEQHPTCTVLISHYASPFF